MKLAKFGFLLFGINCYVAYDPESKECAIIDPGIIEQREKDALKNFISKNGLKVTNLINTHLHIDHCIGNNFIIQEYGVGNKAHKGDEILGERVKQQAMMFGINEPVNDVEISTYLEEGDIIKIGNDELKVIHIPGHSQGSIALYNAKDKFIIVGDILFQGSIGRTDLPGGNHTQLITGIKKKLMSLPDDVTVYPGHGPSTTIGEERTYNPYLY